MEYITITSVYYHTLYCTFSLSLAWFGAICNMLPHVIVKLLKKMFINIFF